LTKRGVRIGLGTKIDQLAQCKKVPDFVGQLRVFLTGAVAADALMGDVVKDLGQLFVVINVDGWRHESRPRPVLRTGAKREVVFFAGMGYCSN
jgi:hypothetical protein